MIKSIRLFIVFVSMISIMASCYTTQMTVGDVSEKTRTEQYSKSKQFYLFWGIIPLGKNEPKTPENNYVVEGKFKLGDILISGLTGGIVGARTTTVYVPK